MSVRALLLTALVAGLGRGHSGPETLGLCAQSPLLSPTEPSCSPGTALKSQKFELDQQTPVTDNISSQQQQQQQAHAPTSNQTGWDGPSHCVKGYCVYSNRDFGGGIVAVTTSANAKILSQLTTDAAVNDGEPLDAQPPAFYATEIPGKGIGLVANRTIRQGELIMARPPTFMVHHALHAALDTAEHERILDAALAALPPAAREAFLAQMGRFGGHRVGDILLTNAFQTALDDADPATFHLGSFPALSRFNHDCRPSVATRVAQLAQSAHAARDVPAGEELSIAYLNPFEPHAVRQAHTRQSWGFACACRQCSAGAAESDARLREIEELEAELGDFGSRRASTAMARRLLALYEAERLHVKMHGAYVLAALNYNLVGDADNARRYAELAVRAGLVEYGPEAADVKAMRELAADPRGHFTWMKRVAHE